MPGPTSSPLTALSDPTDLPALREALAAEDPDGRLVPLDLQRIVIGPDALDSLVDIVAEQLGGAAAVGDGPIVVLCDATPIQRAGEDLKALVVDRLTERFGTGREVRRAVLRGQHATLHVDDDAMDAATEATADAAAVVSVGGGTITDIGKVATARNAAARGAVPLVVVQTAASVDGYTDNVSVILRDGVKRTVPSRWPGVVLADVTTISGAPNRLNTAGYGEVLSMFVAPADWYLASVFGLDPSFHPAPRDLLAVFGRGIEQWSPGVSRRDLGSVEQLTRMLAIRGVATGVAGTTACLSGVEHLVSHMFDMHNGAHHQPIGLHGAQVGVASVVAAAAWEHFLRVFDPAKAAIDELFPDEDAIAARRDGVVAAFADLDPSGKLGAECWRGYSDKLTRWSANRERIEAAFADWDRHRAAVDALLVDARTLGAGLVAAGAPARFTELDPVIDEATVDWAVENCHLMRDRFVILDLLALLGHWTDDDRAAVRAAAAAAVDAAPSPGDGGAAVTAPPGLLRRPDKYYDGYVFDLDGTVYLGDALLPGAGETVAAIRDRGARTVFLSNNPTRDPQMYADKLGKLGIETSIDDIVNPVVTVPRWLKTHHPDAAVFAISEEPLKRALTDAGVRLTEDPEEIDIVLASYDRTFEYRKLQIAFDAIWFHKRARLITSNPDRYCPMPGGRGEPDAASIVAAIEACTQTTCEANLGKPGVEMLETVLGMLGLPARSCVMIGDRLSTDIAMAAAAGMDSALVLTGETTPDMAADLPPGDAPTWILDRIDHLLPDGSSPTGDDDG